MITIESSRLSGKITLTPHVTVRSDGSYAWMLTRDGWCSGNPVGGGATVTTSCPDMPSGIAESAHEAEMACAAALTQMARAVRRLVAEAETRLTDRETANQAAADATDRLRAITIA